MSKTEKLSIHVTLLLNRLALGVLFALAGVRKLLPSGEAGIWDKMKGFAAYTADKAPLPEIMGKIYGYALPWAEILAGVLLVLGLVSRAWSVVIALMLVSFLIAMGVEWWPSSGPAYSKNIILLTLALLLAVLGSGKFAIKPDGPMKS